MSLARIFLDIINKVESIKYKDRVIVNPVRANNFAKTPSNVNNVFKEINIWDNQIDEMVKGTGYSFNTDGSVFIELQLGEGKMLLNNVTSYPDSKMIFHIFSILLDGSKDTMERNLKIFEFRDILKSNTLGWSPSNCSSFMCCIDTLDYKHGNITKHLLGYDFNFIDKTGSIFDTNSPNYQKMITIEGATLGSTSIFTCWKSGFNYYNYQSVIINGYEQNNAVKTPLVYICTVDNSDIIFNINNWLQIYPWQSKKSYVVNNIIYYLNHIYECLIDNTDNIFIPNNWELIA